MFQFLRVVVGAIAAVILFGGALLIVSGYPVSGLTLVIVGGIGVVAVTLERRRYRSAHAERTQEAPGPGGGETGGPLEGRFQRSAEVFIDPTTGHRMRVWVDPASGERRYVAEG